MHVNYMEIVKTVVQPYNTIDNIYSVTLNFKLFCLFFFHTTLYSLYKYILSFFADYKKARTQNNKIIRNE